MKFNGFAVIYGTNQHNKILELDGAAVKSKQLFIPSK